MKKNLLNTVIISLFSISSFSQIEIGKIEKAVEVEKKVNFPPYNPTENFIEHSAYYQAKITQTLESGSGKNPFEEKQSDQNEYYNRYNGLKIYYPIYSDNYGKEDIFFFKKKDKIEQLNWSQTGNKYFKIISINPLLEKSEIYNEAKNNFDEDFFGNILFELKDDLNGETIYVIESTNSPKFVLVPYFEKKKELITGKTFIAVKDFSADRIPISKTNFNMHIDKGTQWKGELKLLRKKDLKIEESNEADDEDILFMVLLSNEKDKVMMELNGGRWNFQDVLLIKNDFEKLKNESINKQKLNESILIKKYGEKFGKLVYQNNLTIGMSKDMCSDILGITLNKKMYKNANGEMEVWEYTGIYKLYFKNGKLSEIIKY
ncbi:hypothetical protein [Flavobacterium eburneipallidum]|uniref:hypothetical protein n=1 Tax=Flavobacterium eburneipallidum TaxID=3003263 RepID=UPI00248235FB|nr:hypothetical protein [Flavobacterium eburneipallidum]